MSGISPRSKPGPATWAAVLGGAALTGASAWVYAGPYRWFAELQMRMSGGTYSVKLTLVLSFALIVLPLLGAARLLGMFTHKSGAGGGGPAGPEGAAAGAQGGVSGTWSRGKSLAVAVVMIFAVLLGMGVIFWGHGASLGSLTRIAARDLEAGRKPESGYLEIEGNALWDYAPSMKDSTRVTYYAPLVSADWQPPKPVAAYVASSAKMARNPFDKGPAAFKGIRSLEGMPGPIKADFEKSDFKPADGFIVLSLAESPDGYLMGGRILTLIGGAGTAIGAVLLVLARLSKPATDAAGVVR